MSASPSSIEYDFCATRFGDCLFARTGRGLCRIEFTDEDREPALARLRAAYPDAELRRAPLASLAARVFAGGHAADLPVDADGTPFQQQVWRALRCIPRGATRSYGELAAAIGRPGAARAVGRAVASNPVAVLVPCHRVLPAAGGAGGYRWGPQRKVALLDWEAAKPA
jgi:AraC family transcriptional regulator of adaptative response/methylated-DNA-[protein]-cysteine methyltransferase